MKIYGILVTLLLIINFAGPAKAAADFKTPSTAFAASPQPPAPDYANKSSWLVWPGIPSSAAVIPKGVSGTFAKSPAVDVFFIHPTTYLSNATWNARYNEGGATGLQLEKGVLRYQTSVFNGCCRIYAPRYRQTTISAFLKPGKDSKAAYDLAYSDVVRAFDYYIATQNHGRPFILASHSQGSLHATRLLLERIANNPALRHQLVAGYVIGASLPESTVKASGIGTCQSAEQTGCIINWNSTAPLVPLAIGSSIMITYANGNYQTVGQKTWLCVNPLTWRKQGTAKAAQNRGSLPAVGNTASLPSLVAGVTGATCQRGRLIVRLFPDKRKGFIDPLTRFGSYHNHDYNLFYASIRQNAIDRVNAYLNAARR